MLSFFQTLGNGVLLPPDPFQSSDQSRFTPKVKPAISMPATSMPATSVPAKTVPTKLTDPVEAERLRKSIASLGHTKIMSNINKLIKYAGAPAVPSNNKKLSVANFARYFNVNTSAM